MKTEELEAMTMPELKAAKIAADDEMDANRGKDGDFDVFYIASTRQRMIVFWTKFVIEQALLERITENGRIK